MNDSKDGHPEWSKPRRLDCVGFQSSSLLIVIDKLLVTDISPSTMNSLFFGVQNRIRNMAWKINPKPVKLNAIY